MFEISQDKFNSSYCCCCCCSWFVVVFARFFLFFDVCIVVVMLLLAAVSSKLVVLVAMWAILLIFFSTNCIWCFCKCCLSWRFTSSTGLTSGGDEGDGNDDERHRATLASLALLCESTRCPSSGRAARCAATKRARQQRALRARRCFARTHKSRCVAYRDRGQPACGAPRRRCRPRQSQWWPSGCRRAPPNRRRQHDSLERRAASSRRRAAEYADCSRSRRWKTTVARRARAYSQQSCTNSNHLNKLEKTASRNWLIVLIDWLFVCFIVCLFVGFIWKKIRNVNKDNVRKNFFLLLLLLLFFF